MSECPPFEYLQILMKRWPIGRIYCELWSKRDQDEKLTIPKVYLERDFLINDKDFKDVLFVLAAEGLISVDAGLTDAEPIYMIEITGYDCSGEGLPLC
jgi:hypothetical protein